MTNASRAPVDLEALARDLRREETRGQAGGPAGKGDPLAELARIVGQDDPFRALLAARDEGRDPGRDQGRAAEAHLEPAWTGRVEPSFAPEQARHSPADAFDQYLASVERDTHDGAFEAAPAAGEAAAPAYEEGRALRRVRPRRRLASVGAGIAVVAVAITGALTYKATHGGGGGGGGVPVVQPDATPLKVAPKVADGVEIPDQNRQIYDKAKKDGQIRIVNREEQPLDVAEAARAAQGVGPAGGQGTTPGSGPFEAFGEPRRVRTVAVRPEAPPTRETQGQAQPQEAPPSPIPTMVLPGDPAPAKGRPARQVSTAAAQTGAVQGGIPQTGPVEAPAAVAPQPAPKPVAVKPAPKAAQRVAAVAPETTAQDAPDTTAATDTASADAPVGGFSVQLGVRNSAADAKAALRQMQAKYSQLAGKPELIRQAEVNGKSIYRVRVGPLAKAEASSLCSALQGEGGQCFVAKN